MTHDPDAPAEAVPALDPRAAALLTTYRRGAAMPPDARARVRAGLRETRSSGHVLEDRRRTRRGWAVVLAVAAVIALVWALGEGRRVAAERPDAAVMSPSQGQTKPQERAAQPGEPRPGEPPHAAEPPSRPRTTAAPRDGDSTPTPRDVDGTPTPREFDGTPTPRDVDGTPTPREFDGTPTPRDVDGTPTPRDVDGTPTPRGVAVDGIPVARELAEHAPVDSLRDETAILAQGWRALAAGDVAAASAAVDEHRRRFIAGALRPEREALAAVAACTREADAVALARTFLAAHPRSPLTRRVREACRLTRDSEAR